MDSPVVYWIKVALAIGVIIGAFGYLLVYIIEQRDKKIEEKKSALSGKIESQKKTKKSKIVTIDFGGSKSNFSRNKLKGGILYKGIKMWEGLPLFIKLKGDTLLVSIKVRSRDNKIVAEIIDNEWKVNPNNYFRRNYDKTGFEVIDEEGILKFQIHFVNDSVIKVGGVFASYTTKNQYSFVYDNKIFGNYITDYKELITQSETVPNLFKYPEDKYFGVRADK